jgi:CRP-like cAMP-binding protein
MSFLENNLRKFGYVSPECMTLVKHYAENTDLPKGNYVVRQGQFIRPVILIESGFVTVFRSTDNEDRHAYLLTEGHFAIDPISFFQGKPAYFNIQTLEKTTVWRLYYHELEEICKPFPDYKKIVDNIDRHYRGEAEKRNTEWTALSPRERLAQLEKENPDLLTRTPKDILLSYLQMTGNTYHAIQKERSGKKKKG